jgi:low affinity Fe/Cu permease
MKAGAVRSGDERSVGAATEAEKRARLQSTPGASPGISADVTQDRPGRPRNRTPFLEAFSQGIAKRTGSSLAFSIAVAFVLVWALSGPLFGFSDTWQLVVNTATTVVTFLMVFLIQRAQNKDTHAIELKLNELLAAVQGASNRLIDVEDLSEEELQRLRKDFQRLVAKARHEASLTSSHTVEETRRG